MLKLSNCRIKATACMNSPANNIMFRVSCPYNRTSLPSIIQPSNAKEMEMQSTIQTVRVILVAWVSHTHIDTLNTLQILTHTIKEEGHCLIFTVLQSMLAQEMRPLNSSLMVVNSSTFLERPMKV